MYMYFMFVELARNETHTHGSTRFSFARVLDQAGTLSLELRFGQTRAG